MLQVVDGMNQSEASTKIAPSQGLRMLMLKSQLVGSFSGNSTYTFILMVRSFLMDALVCMSRSAYLYRCMCNVCLVFSVPVDD